MLTSKPEPTLACQVPAIAVQQQQSNLDEVIAELHRNCSVNTVVSEISNLT